MIPSLFCVLCVLQVQKHYKFFLRTLQCAKRKSGTQAHGMPFTDVQRSVRLNKKEKSTNTSPYPDEVIDRLARAFYPTILACWNSEEGQREFAAWQAEQAHHANNEKQKVSRYISIFYSMAPSRILQIFLRIAIQNQIRIAQWVIVDEVIQF